MTREECAETARPKRPLEYKIVQGNAGRAVLVGNGGGLDEPIDTEAVVMSWRSAHDCLRHAPRHVATPDSAMRLDHRCAIYANFSLDAYER